MNAIICPKCGGNGVMSESEYRIPYILHDPRAKGLRVTVTCQRCNFKGKSAVFTPFWPDATGRIATIQEVRKMAANNFTTGKEGLIYVTPRRTAP